MAKFPFSLSFIIAFLLGVVFFLTYILHHPNAEEEYDNLLKRSKVSESSELSSYISRHQRKGIQKDVWMVNDDQNVHICLASNHSNLNFARDSHEGEIVEHMEEMTCRITEEGKDGKKITPFASETNFTCNEAQFDYETMKGVLLGTLEELATFQTNLRNGQNEIPLTIKSPEISIDGKQRLFVFSKPIGTLSIDATREEPLHFFADKLEWHESKQLLVLQGNVVIEDAAGQIYADQVTVEHSKDSKQSILVQLNGNVRIHNQYGDTKKEQPGFEQYALADHVIYDPQTKELVLSGEANKRVLFFDKINHLQVSGQTIKATRNPDTGKDTIKGSGDVRFTFAKQEWETICEKFNLRGNDAG